MTLRIYRFIKARETVMHGLFLFCAVFSILALLAVCIFLLLNGIPFIARIGLHNFLGREWHLDSQLYGILPMIAASLYVTALSTLIGITIGLFTAVFLYGFCPAGLVFPVRQLINLLAGIPSVIYGLFGLTLIVPFLRDNVSMNGVGYGILAASLVLSVMILPTIVSISLEALYAVPVSCLEGALAVGATKEQSIFTAVLPAARSGILAAVVLSVGRAIGETMAVIMVIGGSPVMPTGLFQSVRTMTANIAMGATELSGESAAALIATGALLFFFTMLLNISFSLLKKGGGR